MEAETAHGVKLEVCPNCGGAWLNGNELHALLTCDANTIEKLESTIHTPVEQLKNGPSKLLCPVDHVLMDEYHYLYNSPAIIHTCALCNGMFIHAQDLPLMQQWSENSHKPASKEEELKIAAGLDMAQHEAFMLRQQHFQSLFYTLRGFRPMWYGFLP
jgi:Zn-finger nucleic acid-binding protein